MNPVSFMGVNTLFVPPCTYVFAGCVLKSHISRGCVHGRFSSLRCVVDACRTWCFVCFHLRVEEAFIFNHTHAHTRTHIHTCIHTYTHTHIVYMCAYLFAGIVRVIRTGFPIYCCAVLVLCSSCCYSCRCRRRRHSSSSSSSNSSRC